MNVKQRRALWRVVQVALLALVAWFIYRTIAHDLSELTWDDVLRWRPVFLPLLISFGMLVAVYIAHALLWRMIMRDLRIGNLSVRATLQVYFVAGLGRYIPGKLWQLAGLALLSRRAGLPGLPAAAAQVLGQVAFLTTGLLFLGLSLPDWENALGPQAAGALTLATVVLVVGGGALWALVASPVGHGFRTWLTRRLGARVGERLTAAFELADRVTAGHAIKWAIGYALSWIALGAAFAVFAIAFVPAAALSVRFLSGVVAASYLSGYIAVFAPAGIGVRELAMLYLLEQVMPQEGAALVVSAMSRVWFTAGELVPLAFVPFLPARPAVEEETG